MKIVNISKEEYIIQITGSGADVYGLSNFGRLFALSSGKWQLINGGLNE